MSLEGARYLKLDAIFRPKSVAIIGASSTPGTVGYVLAPHLLKSGYDNPVYLVIVRGGKILGQKAYKSISDIPDEVELAVISIPSKLLIKMFLNKSFSSFSNPFRISANIFDSAILSLRLSFQLFKANAEITAIKIDKNSNAYFAPIELKLFLISNIVFFLKVFRYIYSYNFIYFFHSNSSFLIVTLGDVNQKSIPLEILSFLEMSIKACAALKV